MKTAYGVETVDEINSNDFETRREFVAELKRIFNEYQLAGMNVYTSQRCAKDWK